jgi:hypothetical protein
MEYVPVFSDFTENVRSNLQAVLSLMLTNLANIMAKEPEGSKLLITITPLVTVLGLFVEASVLTKRFHGGHSSFSSGRMVNVLRNVVPFMQPEGSQDPKHWTLSFRLLPGLSRLSG